MAKKSTAAAAGTTNADGTATEKTKYKTMIIGVPTAMKEKQKALIDLAARLGCKVSALIWTGIDAVLASPPKVAPVSSGAPIGTASGFWTVPVRDGSGKATSVNVVEVAQRGDNTDGRTFFRYDKADEKSRGRARNQAIRAAKYDMDMIGNKSEPKVKDLPAK